VENSRKKKKNESKNRNKNQNCEIVVELVVGKRRSNERYELVVFDVAIRLDVC